MTDKNQSERHENAPAQVHGTRDLSSGRDTRLPSSPHRDASENKSASPQRDLNASSPSNPPSNAGSSDRGSNPSNDRSTQSNDRSTQSNDRSSRPGGSMEESLRHLISCAEKIVREAPKGAQAHFEAANDDLKKARQALDSTGSRSAPGAAASGSPRPMNPARSAGTEQSEGTEQSSESLRT